MSTELSTVVLPDGEILPVKERTVDEEKYAGAGTLVLTNDQADLLTRPLADGDHEILPTGEVYVGQVHYRRILNQVFGPGGWALVPRGEFSVRELTLIREYALFVGGRFVSEAIGESDYQPDNQRMSWATTAEAVKSNALMRCCKDLGIASECWDKRFTESFKKEKCVQVWRKPKEGKEGKVVKKNKPEWRRIDAGPFWDEVGLVKKGESQQVLPNPPYTDPPPKMEEDPATEQFRANSATMRKAFVAEMTAIFQEPITPPLKERANALCDKMQAFREGLTEDDLKECQLNWSGLKQRLWPKKELPPETVEAVEPEKEIHF